VNGVDYHFLSQADFDRRVAGGEFLEHAVEIDVQGARQVHERLPNAKRIFIEPPSFDALVERLMQRGADSPEQIERRLAAAREELAARDEFDHHLVNDDLDRATHELAELAARMCPAL
jgi:guanylate kinase